MAHSRWKDIKRARETVDPATAAFREGRRALWKHPVFGYLVVEAGEVRKQGNLCPKEAWAVVTSNGEVHAHPSRRGEPAEWTYALAHCLLHLAFGHFQERADARAWNLACCTAVDCFLAGLKLGRAPVEYEREGGGAATEERLYERFRERGVPAAFVPDLVFEPAPRHRWRKPPDWQALFGAGLADAVSEAVAAAAGVEPEEMRSGRTPAQRARAWFIDSYPLLGALAAAFTLIEDPRICARMQVSIAAVHPELREIYVNPTAGLDADELRFVLAHELLHVGLRHETRRRGRDPFLWNCAADYAINGWLVEMGVGALPRGVLYDPALKGESAESIYDRIATDLRRARRLATLRGTGLGDVLDGGRPAWWESADGCDLDAFYRSALAQGLSYHAAEGRGLLPAGLEEEIRALGQPPVPWDVELARWFDRYFPALEPLRSYARPSRRQSATPEIPRPSLVMDPAALDGRTFGVVLDTSGSMNRELLAKALGAIAGYS